MPGVTKEQIARALMNFQWDADKYTNYFNLCERKARIIKGKINQAISLRSFEQLAYFCECLSIFDHFATSKSLLMWHCLKEGKTHTMGS